MEQDKKQWLRRLKLHKENAESELAAEIANKIFKEGVRGFLRLPSCLLKGNRSSAV